MTILIDNGHGRDTPGKRSPDDRLMEWEWTRRLARMVASGLEQRGADARLLTPEDDDTPIAARAERANAICRRVGAERCRLVSIHANAAAMGQWAQARGWGAYVDVGAAEASRRLASALVREAAAHGLTVRSPLPHQPYWTQRLGLLRRVACAAVLTENLFMDNAADLEFMLSDEGMATLADIHINALLT